MKLAHTVLLAALATSPCAYSGTDAETNTDTGSLHRALDRRLTLTLGLFRQYADSHIRVDSHEHDLGTTVGFEDDLGLARRRTPGMIRLNLRLRPRWQLELEHHALRRTQVTEVDETVEWEGELYPANTVVTSRFELDITRLGAAYSLLRQHDREAGIAAGIHFTRIDTHLAAENVGRTSAAGLLPLPTVGVFANYAYSSRSMVRARANYMTLRYEDYEGMIVDGALALEYRLFKATDIGLGYRYLSMDLRADEPDFDGRFGYRVRGPTLYFSFDLLNLQRR